MPFNNARAQYAVDFIRDLKLNTGRFAGKNFPLLPWQSNFISDVYGTVNEKGNRQYNFAYLEVPKKNGKSSLGAGIALYHTFADGEQKGEIYGCAADRSQASLVFDIAVDMVDMDPILKSRCKLTLSQKMLTDKITGSKYKVLSSEAYTKHGYNVSCCIFDELHNQPDDRLWRIMTTGSGDSREEPMWYVITTAGDDADRLSIGWEIHEKAQKIIAGELIDPTWYCKIWGVEPDFGGDIYDEELWHRVNPSLGYTIGLDKVRQAAVSAKSSPAEEKLFRWLRLNQWLSLKKLGWLDLTLWDTSTGKWKLSDMINKKCYAGLDLASTTDLTGLALLFPPQDGIKEWRFILEGWVPEDNMKIRVARDHVPYDKWVAEKYLHATSGNTCDYDFVKARILTLAQQFKIKYLCCDPWNSRMLTQQLEKTGLEVIEVSQNIAGMSPGMKEIERLLKSELMTHEKNPLGRWCFGNVIIAVDGNENIKPMKNKSRDRIDPIVALINAMSIAITQENIVTSLYEGRGMRIL